MLFVAHLDTYGVIARLYRIAPDIWTSTPEGCEQMTDPKLPHKTLLLRVQNKASLENWLDDLPMYDRPVMDKWSSLKNLLIRARKAVQANQVLREMIDLSAPTGRVVISVLKPRSVMAWHSDVGDYAKRHLRFHVPLLTNPACTLYDRNTQCYVPVGQLVCFDATEQHCAGNWGDTPRAHLIFELRRKDADDAAA